MGFYEAMLWLKGVEIALEEAEDPEDIRFFRDWRWDLAAAINNGQFS